MLVDIVDPKTDEVLETISNRKLAARTGKNNLHTNLYSKLKHKKYHFVKHRDTKEKIYYQIHKA
jgi:hypothetical protein